MKVYQPGTLEGDAGLRQQSFQQDQVGRAVATCLTARRYSPGYSTFGNKRCNQPVAGRQRWRREPRIPKHCVQPIMDEHRTAAGGEVKQRARVGAARGPAEHEVDGFGLALKQGHRNLTRRERFSDVPHEEVDHRGPAERPRHLLTEGGQPTDE